MVRFELERLVTVEIPLTRGLVALVDDEDAEWLRQWRWCALSTRRSSFYACRRQGACAILMHRELLQPPLGYHCDHIDGNGLDNRRANLRLATPSQNAQNSRAKKKNSTGFRGVYREGERFVAQIRANRVTVRLGRFKTAESAHAAYCEAARRLHGEFARFE